MPETKLNDEKVLQMFVDRLIADKGGDTLEAKQKETLQGELLGELDERIQAAMIKALPDAKLMELEGLLDAEASDEEIENLFKNAGVSFDESLKKAMDEFRTDYFRGKIKTSVKLPAVAVAETVATEAVAEAPKVETQPIAPAAEAQPVQGATSAVPGQSDVNGVASATQMPAPVASAAQMPEVQPLSQPVQAQAVSEQPAQQVAPAQEAMSTQQVASTPVATPEQVAPLQAAPDLMDALNAATANLNAATANLNTNNGMTGEEA